MVSQMQGKPRNTHSHPCQELGKPGHGSPPSAEVSVRPVSQVLPEEVLSVPRSSGTMKLSPSHSCETPPRRPQQCDKAARKQRLPE